jgi:hypothetical protein
MTYNNNNLILQQQHANNNYLFIELDQMAEEDLLLHGAHDNII